MKHLLQILFFAFCLGATQFSLAQELSDYRAIGLSVTQPQFKNGFATDENWYGVHAQFSNFYFDYHLGSLYKKGRETLDPLLRGYMWNVGYSHLFFKVRKPNQLSVTTVRLIPFADVGLSYVRAGIDGEDRAFSWGLKLAPGMMVKFPFGNVSLKWDTYFLINNTLLSSKNDNAFTDIRFSPTLSFSIDGLEDIFNPRDYKKSIDYQVQVTTSNKVGTYYDWGDHDKDGNTLEKVDVYRESTRTDDRTEKIAFEIVENYWHTGVKLTAFPQRDNQGLTLMYGPMTGFRFGMFGIDGFYQRGQIGLRSLASVEELAQLSLENVNFNLSAAQPVSVVGGTFAMDILKMSIRNSTKIADVFWGATTFTRLMLRYNYQQITKNGDLKFTYDEAEALMLNNASAILPENNPYQLGKTTSVHGMGVALELGAASFSYDYNFTKTVAPLLNRHSFSFSIGVPLIRLVKTVSGHLKLRKAVRKAKREAKQKAKATEK